MKRTKKKLKQKKKKGPLSLYRWLFSLLVVFLLYYFSETHILEKIEPGEAPILYSNVCHDDLAKMFTEAIQSAHQSILLIIYSLSDTKLIHALNAQAEKGVVVKVIHDGSTPPAGFQKLCAGIDHEKAQQSGLMHQKILVIDSEKVLIGSANMTGESLRIHDNLVVGLINPQLAKVIEREIPYAKIISGGQPIEFWVLPERGERGVEEGDCPS